MSKNTHEHDHCWNYVHAIYSGQRGGMAARRWCADCGEEQVGAVSRWREPRENEFDTPAAEAKR